MLVQKSWQDYGGPEVPIRTANQKTQPQVRQTAIKKPNVKSENKQPIRNHKNKQENTTTFTELQKSGYSQVA